MPDIHDFLRLVLDHKASDLHLKAGSPPTLRVSGNLGRVKLERLSAADCEQAAMVMMSEDHIAELKVKGEVDFAHSEPGVGRFRVNVHRQRGSIAIAARLVLATVPSFQSLGLPNAVEQLANEHRGLLLVTGPTSSGKTTTTGAIISHINNTRPAHILTIEDPIEILHNDQQSVVTQREIGQDTGDFATALRAAMRQDPDVIFVGEIRDTETVRAALQAAETGHFVVATMHTTDVSETVNRVIDFFPPHQQNQARVALASTIAGVVSQRLLPRKGGGRVAAIEVMVMNGRIRDLILSADKTHMMHEIIAESGFYGMQTFDQALLGLYRQGLVTLEDAKNAATNSHDFQIALRAEGLQEI
ncbi:MAG: type IV pilus twitching motility protein PilT [Actinomycetota bacterium]